MDQNQTQGANPANSGMDTAKLVGIIGYIVPILFFLPLVVEELKNNDFAKFHANQQLLLLIGWLAASVLSMFLIGLLLYPVLFVFTILGVINAAQGTKKPLPLIGNIVLLK